MYKVYVQRLCPKKGTTKLSTFRGVDHRGDGHERTSGDPSEAGESGRPTRVEHGGRT